MKKEHYSWLYILAVVIAVVTAFIPGLAPTLVTTILAVLGIILGIVNVSGSKVESFLIATVALIVAGLASRGLENIMLIGSFVPPVLTNLIALVAPAAIIVALKTLHQTAHGK